MARVKKQKTVEVQKFGGTEELGEVKLHGHQHSAATSEAQSETKLEFDVGHGNPVVIRRFTFGANPAAFSEHPPTKQELFNAHHKGIEIALWRDGLKVFDEVMPRIVVNQEKSMYDIFVAARPMKGHMLREMPQTLSQVARGESLGTE